MVQFRAIVLSPQLKPSVTGKVKYLQAILLHTYCMVIAH
jgi:hypothetical protein